MVEIVFLADGEAPAVKSDDCFEEAEYILCKSGGKRATPCTFF